MKVSDITVQNITDYLRDDYVSINEVTVYIDTAKAFIKSYTGLTEEQIDTMEDFTIVVYILCQDMHDNRRLYVDKNNLNRIVDTILGMHCVNLL